MPHLMESDLRFKAWL